MQKIDVGLLQEILCNLLSDSETMSLTQKEEVVEKIKQLSKYYRPNGKNT